MKSIVKQPQFLPMTSEEMTRLGWSELDILLVSGDAYVDHPSFGVALLGRFLVQQGFRVGVIAQPQWNTTKDIMRLGRPRLFVGVTAGAMDSLLGHYTAFRKKRSEDAYTPGGRAGARPNRACIVYTNLVRQAFPGMTVVLGGIEASLRKVTHYDFWSDNLRRSILLDAKADAICYGMAEKSLKQFALLRQSTIGNNFEFAKGLYQISGLAFLGQRNLIPQGQSICELPSHEDHLQSKKVLMQSTLLLEKSSHQGHSFVVQKNAQREVILTPPSFSQDAEDMDQLYALPFTRDPHPSYQQVIPAVDMIRFSQTSHRGCGGGCSFCSLAAHQGRRISSRSHKSLLKETQQMVTHAQWKGSISDVGGPSCNMWQAQCHLEPSSTCQRSSCLWPRVCDHFKVNLQDMMLLLDQIKNLRGVKNVRVASGLRHDLAMGRREGLETFIQNYVGGQLKIAPEHLSDSVLRLMRKPSREVFERFLEFFTQSSKDAAKEQYVVPYLMSAFPGCTDEDMEELVTWLRRRQWKPQQVQCFIPTPGTVATAMFYGACDERGNSIFVAQTDAQRMRQHYILVGNNK